MNGIEYPPDETVRKELVAQVRSAAQRSSRCHQWLAWLASGLGGLCASLLPCRSPLLTCPASTSALLQVRKAIGPIATPDVIHWAPGLPKTRSGKIMRRGECNFYGL